MINLLLPIDRLARRRDYRRRRFILAGFLLAVLLVLASLMVGSFYLRIVTERRQLERELAQVLGVVDVQRFDRLRVELAESAKRLTTFRQWLESDHRTAALLTKLISLRPAGISLGSIHYLRHSDVEGEIKMSGQATTRAVLLDWVAALKSEPIFSNIESPVSDLIKNRQVDFDITLDVRVPVTHQP
ncbi:MAG: hypothetical protein AAB468_00600 [Patescibacteria group bacterium]